MRRGSLSFLITGDEEWPAINGTPKLLDWLKARGETLDACLVGEPASAKAVGDEIKIGRRGYVNAELVVQGKQGHSAYADRAENPIPKLARIIDRLSATPLDQGTPHFQPSSMQATIISVPNTATNVIPGSARPTSTSATTTLHTRGEPRSLGPRPAARRPPARSAPASRSLRGHGRRLSHQARAAGRDHGRRPSRRSRGARPALTTNGGTSDARFIKDFCPVVEFGLVNATVHQVDEHVPIADLDDADGASIGRFIDRYFAA